MDRGGNVLIADLGLSRIREVLANPPSFQISADSLAFTAPAGSSPVAQSVTLAGSIPGIPYTASAPPGSPWLSVSPASGFMPVDVEGNGGPVQASGGRESGFDPHHGSRRQPGGSDISVALTVTAAGAPSLSVNPASMGFSFVQQSAGAFADARRFRISAAARSARAWPRPRRSAGIGSASSAGAATIGAFGSTSVNITADPTGLAAWHLLGHGHGIERESSASRHRSGDYDCLRCSANDPHSANRPDVLRGAGRWTGAAAILQHPEYGPRPDALEHASLDAFRRRLALGVSRQRRERCGFTAGARSSAGRGPAGFAGRARTPERCKSARRMPTTRRSRCRFF